MNYRTVIHLFEEKKSHQFTPNDLTSSNIADTDYQKIMHGFSFKIDFQMSNSVLNHRENYITKWDTRMVQNKLIYIDLRLQFVTL